MYLIAESGSTKTQWCLVNTKEIISLVNTPGINPLISTVAEIQTIMRPVLSDAEQHHIEAIYYYGAGCATPTAIEKIKVALHHVFQCPVMVVESDLIAACLALAGNRPAIIGLLGTGSNSCLWSGSEVEMKIPSLGYVLADEGGGVAIGKKLITDYLKLQMPENIRGKFADRYDITASQVIERVYQSPMPNRFLAGFAPFAEEHINDPYCQSIVQKQFVKFFKRNILLYPNPERYDLSFCGSIAYSHADILMKVGEKYGLSIKKIVKQPISDLAIYFQQQLKG